VMVEELLQLFVGKVDAKLFETVELFWFGFIGFVRGMLVFMEAD